MTRCITSVTTSICNAKIDVLRILCKDSISVISTRIAVIANFVVIVREANNSFVKKSFNPISTG